MLHEECMAEARAMGADLTPTRMVDGPYRSSLWRGIIADLTGEVVHYVPDFPGTAYGDAMLAAISTGMLTEEKAFTWVPEAWVIEPSTDPDRVEAYRMAKERFTRFRARFSEDIT
jgi:sugar (pentulose or hexulose) kinase